METFANKKPIMKHIFTISLCFLALSLSSQETITYPYNPDGDDDGTITVPDIQDILENYGVDFSPSEIQIDCKIIIASMISNVQNNIPNKRLALTLMSQTDRG